MHQRSVVRELLLAEVKFLQERLDQAGVTFDLPIGFLETCSNEELRTLKHECVCSLRFVGGLS